MVLYQAVEIAPGEPGANPFGYDPGIMNREAAVTGTRNYGKDTTKPIDYREYRTPQERKSYCAIRAWAKSKAYKVLPNVCGSP
jgi:hypothetical protein